MNRLRTVMVAALLTASAASAVSQTRLGPVVSATWAGVVQQEDDLVAYDTALRWGGGGCLELPLGSRTALLVEPMLAERGAKGTAVGSIGGVEGSLETDVRLRYVEVPVLFRWDVLKGTVRPYLAGGASVGYLAGATVRSDVDGGSETIDVTEELRRTEVGLVFAAGVWAEIGRTRWFLEGRLTQGLLNLDTSGETHVNNQSVGVLAGVTFALGGH